MQLFRGRTNHIWHLAISPDGSKLVAGGSPIHVWDLNDSKSKPQIMSVGERGSWGHEFQFLSATQLFVKTSQPDRWYRCDIATAEVIELAPNQEEIKGDACVHLPSELLKGVVGGSFPRLPRVVTYWIGPDGLAIREAATQGPSVRRVMGFTPCGSRYIAEIINDDGITVSHHLLDTISDAKIVTFAPATIGTYWNLNGWCFSPDSRYHFVISGRKLLCYSCASGGQPSDEVGIPKRIVEVHASMAMHPDGRMLATVEDGRAVTFRDADTLDLLRTYDFAMPTVTCVAFTPDGTRCVIGNSRGKVLLFDVE